MKTTLGRMFLKEIEAEVSASRKCLERIPDNLFEYRPHEKSMKLGYLAEIVADVPRWIAITVEKGEINFATWEKKSITNNADLLKFFDDNVVLAKKALENVSDEELETGMFYLKMGDKVLMQDPKGESVASEIRHWVHHRGQLTVYMRLNNIPVPEIYGPSADENTFM